MSYKIKLALKKSKLIDWVLTLISKYTPFMKSYRQGKVIGNDYVGLIQKYVSGKSFADIGCMWGVHGKYTFVAEQAGTTRTVGVDVYPASPEFLEQKKTNNSKVEFVQGDMNLQATVKEIGVVDVVFCAGVLYHTPNPMHFLYQLRAICGETLILNTNTIPEIPGIDNGAVFYPHLSAKQRKLWRVDTGRQRGISTPYEPESGYGNWFWGMTNTCVASLLENAGFKVEEIYAQQFSASFICSTIPIQFAPVSGDWTTPNKVG